MKKIIIIDDEPPAREVIKEYLNSYPDITIVAECGNGFEGVKAISEHQPDLVFLDIQMPKLTGFEMLELLDEIPQVIFTTAFDEYAIKAFETCAIDYLLKPFSKERFDSAIKKWEQHHGFGGSSAAIKQLNENTQLPPRQNERVVVKKGTNIIIIPVKDILYFEAYDDYVKIHTVNGVYLKKKTMNYFESVADSKQFVRIHRSFLLQVNQVSRIEPYTKDGHLATLKNGEKLPISKAGYGKLKSILEL